MTARREIATPQPPPAGEHTEPCDHDGACITCGDLAAPMRVLEVDAMRALAVCVDGSGREETVDLGILDCVAPGDTVLVHAGTALHRERA